MAYTDGNTVSSNLEALKLYSYLRAANPDMDEEAVDALHEGGLRDEPAIAVCQGKHIDMGTGMIVDAGEASTRSAMEDAIDGHGDEDEDEDDY